MLKLPKVQWKQRLGNIAEENALAGLSCFSNPMKHPTDIGIDFSCELLEQDQPTITFYVQAKGTEEFDENWGRAIEKSTVRYWLTRLFPVYLVVFDPKEKQCYWKSIEEIRYWLLDKMKSESNTIYIKVDRSHILQEGKDQNTEFIEKIKEDFLLVQTWLGHAYLKGEGYVKRMPNPPRSELELARFKANTRTNLDALVIHYLAVNDLDSAYTCLEFLTKFDKSHYDHFQLFGSLNQLLGKIEIAREALSEALAICERDKTWPRESMQSIKDAIRKQISTL
jgi:tetratricopeptide (TPR) repeat protein